MSLLERQLQAELHVLKAEAGRKYPKVREGAERADRCLREIIDAGAASDRDVAIAVRRVGEMEEMLNPALFAFETKVAKFMSLAWGYMTRLASYDALSAPAFNSAVGAVLKSTVDGTSDEHVLLRVLQCIGACLQAPNILSSRPAVCGLVEAALTLSNSKSPVISNTAGATARQGVATLFEFAASAAPSDAATTSAEGKPTAAASVQGDKDASHSSPAQQDHVHRSSCLEVAVVVAGDLILLAVGAKPQILQAKPTATTELLSLDVIDAVLREHGALCLVRAALTNVVHSVVIRFLLRNLERNPKL
jgi:hypothetical protein